MVGCSTKKSGRGFGTCDKHDPGRADDVFPSQSTFIVVLEYLLKKVRRMVKEADEAEACICHKVVAICFQIEALLNFGPGEFLMRDPFGLE